MHVEIKSRGTPKGILTARRNYPVYTPREVEGGGGESWPNLGLVLLTEVLGGVDHVSQGALDLVPLPGLETTVYKRMLVRDSALGNATSFGDLSGIVK